MRAILEHKTAAILFEGKFYDTNRPLDLGFSEAFRLTRYANVKADYENIPYEPELWRKDKFINFFGDIDGVSGFGGVSKALIKYSAPTITSALIGKRHDVRDQTIFAAMNRPLNQAGAMIWHDQPRDQWLDSPFKKNIAIVPFETTRIPRSWVHKLNNFDALFVPCEQNIQMMRDSGVKVPIELIHWGVDSTKYYPVERPEDGIFTFGHMGALSIRKGTDLLVQAFLEAFPTEKDVRLICKSSQPTYRFGVQDRRVVVHLDHWTHEEMLNQFFKQVDCFVFPTRGEGFGLTPLEAMATGIPAIVTGWSGPMEYMTPETGWLLDYKMVPAKDFSEKLYKEDCGDWAEPSKADLIAKMRYAYEHQDEVKAKGKAAAEHVKQNWLWQDKIKMYESALAKHL